jgi:hypothetical protein
MVAGILFGLAFYFLAAVQYSRYKRKLGLPRWEDYPAVPHPFDARWFVYLRGETCGPYSGHQIRQMVEQRKIVGTDLVYIEGGSTRTQLENDIILKSAL